MKSVKFIPKHILVYFHEQLIMIYGGRIGICDESLLDSAFAQPNAMFGGSYLHDSLPKMAAAYGFHLCSNHPFIDGNKRIALVAMVTFLQQNGCEIVSSEKEVYAVIMKLAAKELSKEDLAGWLEQNITEAK